MMKNAMKGVRYFGMIFCIVTAVGYLFSTEAAAQTVRVVDNRDGTVTDTKTGLVWARQDNGKSVNWYEAMRYCQELNLSGHTDWRLPTISELETLFDGGQQGPCYILPLFQLTGNSVWSSTLHEDSRFAYYIRFKMDEISESLKRSRPGSSSRPIPQALNRNLNAFTTALAVRELARSKSIPERPKEESAGEEKKTKPTGGGNIDKDLLMAVQKGDAPEVLALLNRGGNHDVRALTGTPALIIASVNGYHTIVEQLLTHGADVDAKDRNGKTALESTLFYSSEQHAQVALHLISRGAHLNVSNFHRDRPGETPLIWAARTGHYDVFHALLKRRVDVNAVDALSRTALMEAAFRGDERMVRELLGAGADIRIKSEHGETALDYARRHPAILSLLKSNGGKE